MSAYNINTLKAIYIALDENEQNDFVKEFGEIDDLSDSESSDAMEYLTILTKRHLKQNGGVILFN